jgi:hypothetical protein
MAEINQAAAPRQSSASKTTLRLVVAYHFLVAASLCGAIVLAWVSARSSQEDVFIAEVMTGLAATLALLYLIMGWGILRWKNWSRTLSLVLNWINVVGAAVAVARLRANPAGVINALLSCLVLWWLSMPAVKLGFRAGSETR